MFESAIRDRHTSPATRSSVLHASSITAWKNSISGALESSSGLDDPARVDAIAALEELVCVVTAAQASLAGELDDSQRALHGSAGVDKEQQGKGVASQVAMARRESPHRGRQHLGLAKVVRTELPHTWSAWRKGHISEWKVTLIARETGCLPLHHRLEVDRLVAADVDSLERMGDRQVASLCAKEAARLDAASVVKRRRKAESERCVTLRPAPDTMTYLTALLPVKDGVAAMAALARTADSARAAGDERGKGQVMADALVESILKATTEPPNDDVPTRTISLGLVMSDVALFGTSDEPAHLDDFGPIPAELAREIIAGAVAHDEEVWLRRLYTSPNTGELVAMDAKGRCFRGSLSRFVRTRDQFCRTPWCDAPVRHIDHVRRSADDGTTSGGNAQGLCEACNYAKEAPGWRARPGPDGTIETTTPTGHRHTTRPPALATIRRRKLPPIMIDYLLAG